jgi:hypothetical protein
VTGDNESHFDLRQRVLREQRLLSVHLQIADGESRRISILSVPCHFSVMPASPQDTPQNITVPSFEQVVVPARQTLYL